MCAVDPADRELADLDGDCQNVKEHKAALLNLHRANTHVYSLHSGVDDDQSPVIRHFVMHLKWEITLHAAIAFLKQDLMLPLLLATSTYSDSNSGLAVKRRSVTFNMLCLLAGLDWSLFR